jgi:hypothetical protein
MIKSVVDFLKYLPWSSGNFLNYFSRWYESGYFPGCLRKLNVAQTRRHRFVRFLENRIATAEKLKLNLNFLGEPRKIVAPRILMTNHRFSLRTGTELWVAEMALYLTEKNLADVLVYSPKLGALAADLKAKGVNSTASIEDVLKFSPNLIHLQHPNDREIGRMLVQVDRSIPIVNFVHGVAPLQEEPMIGGQRRSVVYMGVSQLVCEKIRYLKGLNDGAVKLINNFFPFSHVANASEVNGLRRAALISSKVTQEDFYIVQAVFRACNIDLDRFGHSPDTMLSDYEVDLADYQIVLGTGKTIIDAMGAGKFGFLAEAGLIGPIVVAGNVVELSSHNYALTCNLIDAVSIEDSGGLLLHVRRQLEALNRGDACELFEKVQQIHCEPPREFWRLFGLSQATTVAV